MIGTVAAMWHYPVKSFQGVPVDAVYYDADGPRGDRAFGVYDVAAEELLSAKRTGALLEVEVHGADARLPDGTTARIGDPALDAALSAYLGRVVRIVHIDDEPSLPQTMAFDNEDEQSMVVRWRTPRGRYVDLFPVHFLTTGSLRAAALRHPDFDFDVRRFRPNVVIDTDVDERSLFGATLRLGDAVVRVPEQLAERCVMTTRAQRASEGANGVALAQQRGLLRALARDTDKADQPLTAGSAIAELGAYFEVVQPGRVALGATVARLT